VIRFGVQNLGVSTEFITEREKLIMLRLAELVEVQIDYAASASGSVD
jgi:hypothetical protein